MIEMRFKRIEQIPCNEMLSILECLLLNAPHCLETHCVSLTQMEHSSSMEKKVPCLFSSKTLSFYALVSTQMLLIHPVGGGHFCCFIPGCVSMKLKEMGPFRDLKEMNGPILWYKNR